MLNLLYTFFVSNPTQDLRHSYNMGLIGNCAYLAYIDTHANIKWLCWPKFDSPSVFGSLLNEVSGGHFAILPESNVYSSRQYYMENTNILCTEFQAEDGVFRVVDFAPRFALYERHHKPLMLFRKIEPLQGKPKIKILCNPRGEYGRLEPRVEIGSNHLRYLGMESDLRLTTNASLHRVRDQKSFVLNKSVYMVLSWGVPFEAPLETTFEDFLRRTKRYWLDWVERCSVPLIYQNETIRSGLVLKLHQFEDTGAIIAAGSMSLPESPHKGRNWDYRYCWLRDSYYTVNALNSLSHFEELESFADYIENVASHNGGQLQPVYKISGEGNIDESELDIPGYLGNQPVRHGNAAYTQVQNDVYGQALLSMLALYVDERMAGRDRVWPVELVQKLLRHMERVMQEPDAGLWEYRGRKLQHAYTYLFHWAGAHAAEKMALRYGNLEVMEQAKKIIVDSAAVIETCFDQQIGAYMQSPGMHHFDASLFQLINMGYLLKREDIAKSHLQKLEEHLRIRDAFFYRYVHDDDFGKPDVAFLVCSFWYVEALATLGRINEAVDFFDELLKSANHLGLLSEDVDPAGLSQWGNFPQTYGHCGVINCAFAIDRAIKKPMFL